MPHLATPQTTPGQGELDAPERQDAQSGRRVSQLELENAELRQENSELRHAKTEWTREKLQLEQELREAQGQLVEQSQIEECQGSVERLKAHTRNRNAEGSDLLADVEA